MLRWEDAVARKCKIAFYMNKGMPFIFASNKGFMLHVNLHNLKGSLTIDEILALVI